jgi:hypothetical protein
VTNIIKFNLYDKDNRRDAFSSFEMRHIFASYFQGFGDASPPADQPSENLLGYHFIEFMKHLCLDIAPYSSSAGFEVNQDSNIVKSDQVINVLSVDFMHLSLVERNKDD